MYIHILIIDIIILLLLSYQRRSRTSHVYMFSYLSIALQTIFYYDSRAPRAGGGPAHASLRACSLPVHCAEQQQTKGPRLTIG